MLSSKNNKPKVLPSLNSFYDSFKSLASDQQQGEYINNDNEDILVVDEELQTLLDSKFTS